uniref:Uncharacterized protein n=1 Tax=viral metagenome TaxID=1070528 RepID=A0A6C0IX30_9ZZZZ
MNVCTDETANTQVAVHLWKSISEMFYLPFFHVV